MRRRQALAAAAVGLAGCTGSARSGPDPRAAETAVRERINDRRADAGIGPLTSTATLVEAARAHCRDMHAREFYGHTNPDGEAPWDRVPCRAAETIHRGEIGRMANRDSDRTWSTRQPSELAGYVVEGWARSDGHRRIMLDGQFGAVGVGVVIEAGEFFLHGHVLPVRAARGPF